MARSLIDGMYDLYLKSSGKGTLYEVPIHIQEDHGIREVQVRVWALNEKEAEERAVAHAHTMEFKRTENIQQRSLGLVLPRSHYKPKGITRTITSPFAVWRDPVYKKGFSNIFGAIGYRFGTMTKLSIKELKKQADSSGEQPILDASYLTNALKVNIISIFIWAGLFVLGVVFLMLGLHPGNEGRFVITWLNPYLLASCVCIGIGLIAEYKTITDYFWIVRNLNEFDREEQRNEDEING